MSLKDNLHDEKRSYIRMKVNTVVSISYGEPAETVKGTCCNLSGAGMLIEIAEDLPIGTEMHVSIPSTRNDFPALNTNVDVIRKKSSGDGSFMYGVTITGLHK